MKRYDLVAFEHGDDMHPSETGAWVHHREAADTIDALVAALGKASQLADIARDWNLDEVEIDGEMVATHTLRDEFDAAIARARGEK